jgi:hypothetical protein
MIVDCDTNNYGCDGGWQTYASQYYATYGAIYESEYPYASGDSGVSYTCQKSGKSYPFKLTSPGYSYISSTYAAFKAGIQKEAINISFAVGDDFMYYSSGIYGTGTVYCDSYLNHAM